MYSHRIRLHFVGLLLALLCPTLAAAHPDAVARLLCRIGGEGAAERFVTVLRPEIAAEGEEAFVISAMDGRPCVTGSTLSAITVGLNWYLYHYAHINLSWSMRHTDLRHASLPLPKRPERRTTRETRRYYLNFCTFSYSMAFWSWERWEEEVDWMALHGVTMPLQLVGLDVVWYRLLTECYGYTDAEAKAFVAGPAYQAWFGMNNLEGWGGPAPSWWYERQATLARRITDRERELGMQPVLPGFAATVPSTFGAKRGVATVQQGTWCGYTRPDILCPADSTFSAVARDYYAMLHRVMGRSRYYAMDPLHEGGHADGLDTEALQTAIYEAMHAANPDASWVVQQWQWADWQYDLCRRMPRGRLVVLELFGDAHTAFGCYADQPAVYCVIPNFGGRTGLCARLRQTIDHYFDARATAPNLCGVGAAPEGIESVSVVYDLLYQLPWLSSRPDAAAWLRTYAVSRYGESDTAAIAAWQHLLGSALDLHSATRQGPHEAVTCARPARTIDRVSTWGSTALYYAPERVREAAIALAFASLPASHPNFCYDVVELTRQALTDYAATLLEAICAQPCDTAAQHRFLALLLDLDTLLGTVADFRLGHWTQAARDIAAEVSEATTADADWLELDNARTLLTTWGGQPQAEAGGLHDYAYRQWQGLLSDFYYPRWHYYFTHDLQAPPEGWFVSDWAWAHDLPAMLSPDALHRRYSPVPEGDPIATAQQLLRKYFGVAAQQ